MTNKADTATSLRLNSIDAFRALTLFLMIFVNDLWTLKEVPGWLGHTKAAEDGMGFSDVIFPAFLFIVGLSIPVAMQNRVSRGASVSVTAQHILMRSLALIIMGFYHVNIESYSQEAWLPKPVWIILITTAFFLIWLDYPKNTARKYPRYLQISGVALLILLAALYKGSSSVGMQAKWWGILGLIGWAYLISSFVFLLSKGRLLVQFVALLFFLFFSSATHLGWLDALSPIKKYIWLVGDGSMPALVTGGVIIGMLYAKPTFRQNRFWITCIILAVAMIVFGFLTRPLWEISKIRATPSWTTICMGISIIVFLIVAYLTDIKGKISWYNLIKPAGISTLTCYLLPYVHQAIFLGIIDLRLPEFLRTGGIGLTKSLLFSFLIIQIAGLLQKRRVRLKL